MGNIDWDEDVFFGGGGGLVLKKDFNESESKFHS